MRCNFKLGNGIGILVGISLAAIAFAPTAALASPDKAKSATGVPPRAASHSAKKAKPAVVPVEPVAAAPNRYFIEFRSRSAASYGHMYVLFGQVNDKDQIVRSEIAGLHPAGDANDCDNCSVVSWTIGHVVFVPSETGASDGDLEEKYVTSRYRVMLDEAQYQDVAAYIKKLQAANPLWNALWRNCVSFGRDIAVHMGLKAPAFTWMEPKDFVDELRAMNGGEVQEPLADATAPVQSEAAVAAPPPSIAGKTSAARQKLKKPAAKIAPAARTAGVASGISR